MQSVRQRALLGVVLLGYLAFGGRFAMDTPPWQTPDEPAHFNYIIEIIEDNRLPVLEEGDYPYERLEALKASGFPEDRTIAGIAYEDYQPPGYYVLAAVPVALSGQGETGRLFAARLFGVFLGAITVTLAWAVARRALPDDAELAIATAAFVAFLPMHLAMNASANNDPLAYVLMGGMLYVSLARATHRLSATSFVVFGGALFAGALLTKVSLYPAAALLIAAEMAVTWDRPSESIGIRGRIAVAEQVRAIARGGVACLGGVMVAMPWFARNAVVYGWSDPLGISRHNTLVVEQAHTAEWIAEFGMGPWLSRYVTFTHNSFWGVFGWMAVFLDPRIYAVLAIVVLFVSLGFVIYCARLIGDCRRSRSSRCTSIALLGLTAFMSLFVYVVYNATFVQHQGRYLFTALIPLAIFFVLGAREIVRSVAPRVVPSSWWRPLELVMMLCLVVSMVGLAYLSLTRYIVPGLM